jgi:hypothetical protein
LFLDGFPDVTPLDFFSWGHIKSTIYKTKPLDIEDLRQRVIGACQDIKIETLIEVRPNIERRIFHCLAVNGVHFENLLQIPGKL